MFEKTKFSNSLNLLLTIRLYSCLKCSWNRSRPVCCGWIC